MHRNSTDVHVLLMHMLLYAYKKIFVLSYDIHDANAIDMMVYAYSNNRIGEKGSKHVAAAISKLGQLTQLSLYL